MYSNVSETRKVQEYCLKMLKEIAEICEKNGLRYYICGGTLLGAVRHQGFIPWDDDMDIMMPRKDYEIFCKIAPDLLPPNIKVERYSDFKSPDKPNAPQVQIIDKDTLILREFAAEKSTYHLWIDVFPLDGMPKNKVIRNLHYIHFMFWYFWMQLSWFDKMVKQNKANRPIHEKVIIKFINATHIGSNLDTIKIMRRMQKIAEKYSFDTSEYCVSLYGSYRKKEIHNRKIFDEILKLKFEDTCFSAPVGYDEELKQYYGEYMVQPKTTEEKEKHHKIKIIKLGN